MLFQNDLVQTPINLGEQANHMVFEGRTKMFTLLSVLE
jgi:hypothetical protein